VAGHHLMTAVPIGWKAFRGIAARYGVAAAAVGATYFLRLAVDPMVGSKAPYILFVLPVVFAILVAGRGPGVFAGMLSLVAGLTLVASADRLSGATLLQTGMFILVCGGIGWLDSRRSALRAAAQQANRLLDLMLEGASGYAIFTIDEHGYITSWNRGATDTLGWSAEQATGQHVSIFLTAPEAHSVAMNQLERARETGRFVGEAWQKRADGSEFIAHLTVIPISEDNGKGVSFAKIVHDVTERKAEENALRRREEHLKSILDTVPDGMVVIDEQGIILSFSPAAEHLFGHSEASVVGKNVSLLMPLPDRERHDGYLQRYLETGIPRIIGIGRIVDGQRADGSTFPMQLSVGEARTPDQRLFTGFIQDLSERRAFQSQLAELQSELIHVSRFSAMGTMASTLAHELNQPLTAIASYSEAAVALLEDSEPPDDETLIEIVSDMGRQSLRAGDIVRRLREFVSKGDVSRSPQDLPKVIEEASTLALVGIREKGVTTHFSLEPDATPALIDKVQIEQVLINLMRNAIEAMENTPVKQLEVTTVRIDADTIQISVMDTGPGIAPAVRDRLFHAFNSSKDTGMGLGLSICRTIVEAHGGRIWAADREGGGTEFHFTLVSPSEEVP